MYCPDEFFLKTSLMFTFCLVIMVLALNLHKFDTINVSRQVKSRLYKQKIRSEKVI